MGIIKINPDKFVDTSPPDWKGFNSTLLSDSNWLTVAAKLSPDLRAGIAAAATVSNVEALKVAYELAETFLQSQGEVLPQEVKDSCQAIADQYNIPITF